MGWNEIKLIHASLMPTCVVQQIEEGSILGNDEAYLAVIPLFLHPFGHGVYLLQNQVCSMSFMS